METWLPTKATKPWRAATILPLSFNGTSTFEDGLTATSQSGINLSGTLRTNGNGAAISLGNLTMTGSSSLLTNNGAAAGEDISVGNIASGSNALTIDAGTGGDVTLNNFLGGGILTLVNSGSTTVNSTVNAFAVDLNNTTGAITFNGGVVATVLTTTANPYSLAFNASSLVTNFVTFLNTGSLTLGGPTNTFASGLVATDPSVVNIGGTVRTNGTALTLGNVVLQGAATIATDNGAPAGSALEVGAITSNGNALTLRGGTAGVVNVDSFAGGGDLTLVNSGNTVFANSVDAGTVTITDTNGDVQFNGVTADEFVTAAENYNLVFNGTNQFNSATATDFLNNGSVTLGGVSTFVNGFNATSPSVLNLEGIVQTSDKEINLTEVTLTGNAIIATHSGSNNGANLIIGDVTGNGFSLTLDGGDTGDVTLNSFDSGNITLANSGNTIFTNALSVGAVNLQDTTGTVTFADDLTASSLNTGVNPFSVEFLGSSNNITNATTFNNIGSITFGGTTTFAGGVTASPSNTIILTGTLQTNGVAMNFGDIVLQGTSSLKTNNILTSGADLSVGNITGNGNALTLDAGTGAIAVDSFTSLGAGGDLTILNAGEIALNNITAANLITPAQNYNLSLLGTNVITNAVTFGNTGSLTLGGNTTFTGGFTANSANTINLNGTVDNASHAINFNPVGGVTLLGNSTLVTTGAIAISTTNGNHGLVLNSGTGSSINGILNIGSLSLTANGGTDIINADAIVTTGAQTYNNAVNLAKNTTLISSGAGVINFADDLNGAMNLTINTAGATVFGGGVGNSVALVSLTTDAPGTTQFAGGGVNTTLSQTYNDTVVLAAATNLNSANGNIGFAKGISGPGQSLTLTGGAGNNIFNLSGNMGVTSVAINGGAGVNSLVFNNTATAIQNWTINAANAGSIASTGIGVLTFGAIQNLTGGAANDNFIFQNILSGAVNGGLGVNKVQARNVTNNWKITAANTGTLAGTIGAGFTNIGSLTGGTGRDTFVFSRNAKVTGTIVGGGNRLLNTLNYRAYPARTITVKPVNRPNGRVFFRKNQLITIFSGIGKVLKR